MTDNQIAAKELLDSIRESALTINAKELELEALRWKASGVTAIRYDKDKVNTSPNNYMEMAVIDCVDREQEIEEDKAGLEEQRGNAYYIVRRIDKPEYRALIEWYYLNGFSAEASISKLCIAERTFYNWREDALEAFGKIMLQ